VWIVRIADLSLKYIFSNILFRFLYLIMSCGTLSQYVYAQEVDSVRDATVTQEATPLVEATEEQEEPDIPPKFFSGVEVWIDYGKLLTLPTKFENKYEGGVNLRFFERMIIAGEFGYATIDPLKAYDNALYYTVNGHYYRAGLDYYMELDPKNFYYVGIRYGSSQFEDRGQFLIDSEFWEDYQDEFGSSDLQATWYELVFGTETILRIGTPTSKIHIDKLFLGWKFRFRILAKFENREVPSVYTIPGYGRTFDKTVPALNFYLKYRFGR